MSRRKKQFLSWTLFISIAAATVTLAECGGAIITVARKAVAVLDTPEKLDALDARSRMTDLRLSRIEWALGLDFTNHFAYEKAH